MEENIPPLSEKDIENFNKFFNAFARSITYVKAYRNRSLELQERISDRVGKIVSCHMLIENLIGTWLIENRNYTNDFLEKNNFKNKLDRLEIEKPVLLIGSLIPAMEQLNRLRNSLVHNIHFDLNEAKIEMIEELLIAVYQEKVREFSLNRKIEEFTGLCILVFSFDTSGIKRTWEPILKDFPGLLGFSSESLNGGLFGV